MRSAADRINPSQTHARHARTAPVMMWILVFAPGFAFAPYAAAQDKPNIIIQTDIGMDADDQQSMIRFLLESNESNVLGLIATDRDEPLVHVIHDCINAYEQAYPNLIKHADGYPTADCLRSVVASGNNRHSPHVLTEGAKLIIRQVDAATQPVWVAAWGSTTTLARAIREVQATRTTAELNAFVSKIRHYEAWGQCRDGQWLAVNFPNMVHLRDYRNWAVTSVQANVAGEADYDWQYADDQWSIENIEGKGPFGTLWPRRHNNSASDQGPTLYLLSSMVGLSDLTQPTWGGWGGRFNSRKTRNPGTLQNTDSPVPPDFYIYTPAHDTHAGYNNWYITTARWRKAVQNEFLARMNWSVASTYDEANHPPVAKVDGSLRRTVTSGAVVNLSAAGSTDPDGDSLTYRWWHYPEPSTYKKLLEISAADAQDASFVAPDVASTQTIHIILEVTDTGTPPLTRYQRVIVTVNPGSNPPAQNPTPVIYDAPWAFHVLPQPPNIGTTKPKTNQSLNVVAGYEHRAANPGEFTYTWTQVSGPTASFGSTNGTANGDICLVTVPANNLFLKYEFRVTVSNGTHSVTAPLTLVTGTVNTVYPQRAELTASAVSSSQINLSWGNRNNNYGYRIARRTGTVGEWVLVAYVDQHVTSYADTGLSAGTTYYYHVQTIGPRISAFPSDIRSATTQDSPEQ